MAKKDEIIKKSAEMADNILKSLGQKDNPTGIFLALYIQKEIERLIKNK